MAHNSPAMVLAVAATVVISGVATSEGREPQRAARSSKPTWVELFECGLKILLKIGIVGSLIGDFARAGSGGTLIVSPEGLEYVSRRRAFRLSPAQVRRVWLRHADDEVIVEYDDGGRSRKVAFNRARRARSDSMRFLRASIAALIEQRDKSR